MTARSLPYLPFRSALTLAATVVLTVAGAWGGARAATSAFPSLSMWANSDAFFDSTRIDSARCPGLFHGYPADTLVRRSRTITLRFLRDRVAEARPDFGGYRVYRMTNTRDSSQAVLLRRYSINLGSELTWTQSVLDTATMQYKCGSAVANDSIITFVDPDSSGFYQKRCRLTNAQGVCISKGDSVFRLVPPPGPHDGFRLWYSVTYERLNSGDNDYEDLFLPDTLDGFARCDTTGMGRAAYDTTGLAMSLIRNTCPNLNSKLRNVVGPIEPTGAPTPNLEGVHVVPNPFRAAEAWDPPGGHELHFVGLPPHATIKVYTVAGDLVATLQHDDAVRDYQIWDLKSDAHRDVASGIYIYRVTSTVGSIPFAFESRFVVIR